MFLYGTVDVNTKLRTILIQNKFNAGGLDFEMGKNIKLRNIKGASTDYGFKILICSI
jgi:hypothetical protein